MDYFHKQSRHFSFSRFHDYEWGIHRALDGPGIVFNLGQFCLAVYR
jgi:hypothetical protein